MCKFNPISLRELITQYNPNKLLIKFKFFLAIYMYMYVLPWSAQITAQYIKNYPENSVSVSHIFVSSYFKLLFLFISISVIHGMTLRIEYENNLLWKFGVVLFLSPSALCIYLVVLVSTRCSLVGRRMNF